MILPRRAAKGCALDVVFIADQGDARLGHNNACGMADVNILTGLDFRACGFMNNCPGELTGDAGADGAGSSVGLVHLLHEHQAGDKIDCLCRHDSVT